MIPILSGLPSRRRITPSTALWVHTATVGVTWVNLWNESALSSLWKKPSSTTTTYGQRSPLAVESPATCPAYSARLQAGR